MLEDSDNSVVFASRKQWPGKCLKVVYPSTYLRWIKLYIISVIRLPIYDCIIFYTVNDCIKSYVSMLTAPA